MKRSRIKPKVSDFQKEFDATKPLVRERSHGVCEAIIVANVFLDNPGPFCEDLWHFACGNRAVHVHHRKYRSRGGTNALSNLLDVCLECHSLIHSQPELSNRLGLSLHAGESEELSCHTPEIE